MLEAPGHALAGLAETLLQLTPPPAAERPVGSTPVPYEEQQSVATPLLKHYVKYAKKLAEEEPVELAAVRA